MQIDRSGQLKGYAAEAATAFVARGEDLNVKIASIVRERSLNGEQASTVCKMANHLVHASLRSADSMVEFDIAEPEKVASFTKQAGASLSMVHGLGSAGADCTEPLEKIASFTHETEVRSLGERQQARIDLDYAKIACENAISDVRLSHAGVQAAMSKLGQRLHKFAQLEGGDLDGVMSQFAQYQPLASRPTLLAKVAAAVKGVGELSCRPVTFSAETMSHLTKEGMEKNGTAVDPAMITPGLSIAGSPVHIINGDKRVWVELDTLIEQYDDLSGNKDKLAPSQDRVRYLRRVVDQNNGGAESTLAARAV